VSAARAEWMIALRRRRLLALSEAPPAHAAAAYTALFVLFGVFGSAIPLVRDGQAGILTRWKLAGLAPGRLLSERLAAQSTLDVLESLPAALLVLALGSGSHPGALRLAVSLAFGLLVANAVGAWAAAAARSLAESALFASVGSLLLLHAAGVFRTPAPGSLAALVESLSPFRVLHETFLQAAGGATAASSGWGPALAVGAGLVGLTVLASGALVESLARSREG